MTHHELRKKFLKFYQNRGHKVIPPAPLVLQNDPTTLFNSSGMQQLVPYLLGQPHPEGKRLVDIQPAIRAQGINDDVIEVGDNRHFTLFEMMGNWSLGDYFKEEQLKNIFLFLTNKSDGLGLNPERLYVSVFEGDNTVPRDDESIAIWESLFRSAGLKAEVGKRIFPYGVKKNWWSRAGTPQLMPPGEPGGPDSEVFFDFGKELKFHETSQFKDKPCHPNCDCGRFLELGNSVFMQYIKQPDGTFRELPNKNVDFGGGLERFAAVVNNDPDAYKTDLFSQTIQTVESASGVRYESSPRPMRIIADHMRAVVMLMAEGVVPDNKQHGSLLRKLVSRIISQTEILTLPPEKIEGIALMTIKNYEPVYPVLKTVSNSVGQMFTNEFSRYGIKISEGKRKTPKELDKIKNIESDESKLKDYVNHKIVQFNTSVEGIEENINATMGYKPTLYNIAIGTVAFNSLATYGLPPEESANIAQKELNISTSDGAEVRDVANLELKMHRDLSRTASAGMFKGGLADHSEIVTKYHTATHLLQAALRQVLGTGVHQEGSNLTAERLRFDFSHGTKLTAEEIKIVEEIVNQQIKKDLQRKVETMTYEEAIKNGAMAFFKERYPEKVTVYSFGDFSKEICGGPHVERTGILGKFKIIKEEAVSSGIRRIYAVLE